MRSPTKLNIDKLASLISLAVLLLAWFLGGQRLADNHQAQLTRMLDPTQTLTEVTPSRYLIHNEQGQHQGWLTLGQGNGYGGLAELALLSGPDGQVVQVALLNIRDTRSYVERVMATPLLQSLPGQRLSQLAPPDAVSGATITSSALTTALVQAQADAQAAANGQSYSPAASPSLPLGWADAAALLLFALAILVSRSRHPRKSQLQWAVMLLSMALLGLGAAALLSASTLGMLIGGNWFGALGSYTPQLLLLLTLGYLLAFNKNLYCQLLCPFGTLQQCLGKLTGAKAASPRHAAFRWFPRGVLLTALCLGLYFRNPAAFTYEPFGIAFGFTGPMALFGLTVLIALTSLVVHRPWCKTLCPVGPMSEFILFNKNWLKRRLNRRRPNSRRQRRIPVNNLSRQGDSR